MLRQELLCHVAGTASDAQHDLACGDPDRTSRCFVAVYRDVLYGDDVALCANACIFSNLLWSVAPRRLGP